ncbi:MAG: hypothetical protein HZC41_19160 [Chloroflexi bacterium]|nr:hypothetical protein [Chloroflexota bacterium]
MSVPTEFEFWLPVASLPKTIVSLDHLMTACARGMVAAQQALDDRARASLERWDEEGIPPSALTLRQCRVHFPTRITVVPRRSSSEQTGLTLAPRFEGRGRVTVSYRYVSRQRSE